MAVPLKTRVLIIGGGVTGAGLARDLALRGLSSIIVEKKDVNAGASGANHGLLHSGARYVLSDPANALECRTEGELLKRLAPHCIEDTGGLFLAVEGDDENYIADFPGRCEQSSIPVKAISVQEARNLEPALSDKIIAAYEVADAAVDPFNLTRSNLAQAGRLGARFLPFSQVVSFDIQRSEIVAADLFKADTGETIRVEAEVVVNAAGAWAGRVAALAGLKINMIFSKGSLLVTQNRLARRVINRLRPATDADILVPGGTVSVLGTSSVRVDSPDEIYPEIDELDAIIREGARMIPELETVPYLRAYCGVRPLLGSENPDEDRRVSRGFALIDHASQGLENFITITGGKLTTYRLMAEKTADLVCRRLGVTEPCRTQIEPLPPAEEARWTEPALAPRVWLRNKNPEDLFLCGCELVPQSVISGLSATIQDQGGRPGLPGIGARSRVGRGSCQGMFCGQNITAWLYDQGMMKDDRGLIDLRAFLAERWRGLRPVLRGKQMVKAELLEALYCGLLGLELTTAGRDGSGDE